MQSSIFKSNFVGFSISAIVLVAGLAACSNSAQNSMPNQTSTGGMPAMDHSSMSHNMDLGPADAEYDLRFIDSMIPHHQGAVEMAKEVLQKSKRPELRKLAQAVIASQDQEINQMQQWRKTWYASASSQPIAWHSQMNHSMPMTQDQVNAMKMSLDLGSANEQFDLRFIRAMIPHHEGAVTMAKDALQKSKRPEIQKLATDIIATQQAEITQMQRWRKTWYNP
jgi:uncharacterized protein (DUF305 family)